jgi:hypothetical protein
LKLHEILVNVAILHIITWCADNKKIKFMVRVGGIHTSEKKSYKEMVICRESHLYINEWVSISQSMFCLLIQLKVQTITTTTTTTKHTLCIFIFLFISITSPVSTHNWTIACYCLFTKFFIFEKKKNVYLLNELKEII